MTSYISPLYSNSRKCSHSSLFLESANENFHNIWSSVGIAFLILSAAASFADAMRSLSHVNVPRKGRTRQLKRNMAIKAFRKALFRCPKLGNKQENLKTGRVLTTTPLLHPRGLRG